MHPGNNHLLAIEWQGITYADHTLPFGLRSALKLFTAVTDWYTWALITHGITDFIHYQDDFLSWLAPDSPDCLNSLNTALQLGTALGLPAVPGKVAGPSTSLTFLGIYRY